MFLHERSLFSRFNVHACDVNQDSVCVRDQSLYVHEYVNVSDFFLYLRHEHGHDDHRRDYAYEYVPPLCDNDCDCEKTGL